MKIDLEIYEQIRHLYVHEGLSQRAIAKRLNISRNTVAKYCNGKNVPWERKDYSPRSAPVVTEDIVLFILKCFEEDATHQIKKQAHTAARIHKRLQDELGFTGSASTIRRVVRDLRNKSNEAFVPLEFDPGEAAQIDFGTAYTYLNDKKTKLKFFCMRLCFSGHYFVKAYFAENEECFLDAHISSFKFFGGIPKRTIFDNARVAVKEGLGAYVTKETKRYRELKAHYQFTTSYCNPRSGNEKGLVENLVGYVRRNALVPMPKVASLAELNTMLEEHCRKYLNHSIKGRTGTVQENFDIEKPSLLPLPLYDYVPEKVLYAKVSPYSLVSFQTNRYSVPTDYCGKEVCLKVGAMTVDIYYRNQCIATHERFFGKHHKTYDIHHYIKLLEAKPRAIFNAGPVRQYIPKQVLSEYAAKQDGQKLLLAHLKAVNGLKETPDITVVPTQLKRYDQLIREVNR